MAMQKEAVKTWVNQYFRQDRAFRLSANLAGGFSYRPAAPDQQPTHVTWQKQLDIVYVLAGVGEYVDVDGRSYATSPGCLYLRMPGEIHSTRIAACPYCEVFFSLPAEAFELLRACKSNLVNAPRVVDVGLDENIAKRFDDFIAEVRNAPESRLADLILRIAQFCNKFFEESPSEQGRRIKQACLLMSSNLSAKISLKAVAREVGLGYSNFRKVFLEQMGVSPGEYMIAKRIEKACEMLSAGVAQKQIAAKLGYSDVQGFSRQFRKRTGLSPGKFVRRIF